MFVQRQPFHPTEHEAFVERAEEIKQELRKVELLSTVVLIASIAIGIIGIVLTASGGVGAVIGIPLILVSLPLGFFSYNSYKVSDGIGEILDNFMEYGDFTSSGFIVDKNLIKNKLREKTFCFGWAIDPIVEEIANKSNKH